MKKYIITLLLAVVAFASCSKLDLTPRGEMADKEAAYKNPTIRSQILAGVYSYMLLDATFGNFIPMRIGTGTDIEISRSTSTGTPENNSHEPKDLNTTWANLYAGVNAANEFIHYCAVFTPESKQEIAEARFLRAYYYFTLVRLFGDVPFRTELMSDLNNTDIPRTSAVVIYDFIVKELEAAQAILGTPDKIVYGHISNTAAQAALADVYLNLSGYLMKDRLPADSTSVLMHKRAAYWCEQVINNSAHDITKTDYVTIFMNQIKNVANVNEQVWELQFKYQRNAGSIRTDSRLGKYNGMQADVAGVYGSNGFIYQSSTLRSLYGKIDPADNQPESAKDLRVQWNCPWLKMAPGSQHQKPVYAHAVDTVKYPQNQYQFFCGKWRMIFAETAAEAADKNYSGCRLSMYRIADVHLMYAEALNGGDGNQAAAIDQINKVRARAKATLITGVPSKDEVFDLIVDERARELCFEGKRRFDLVRWGNYQQKLMELKTSYEAAENQDWVKDKMGVFDNFNPESHYIMPIPQSEISRNPLIPQSEQNEGWGGSHKWR